MPTHYRGTLREERALNTFIKLTRATESLLARLNQRGSQGGLSPTQFGVMESLLHLGPMCQTTIGEKLLKSGGNITLVIDNLEKRGLVTRQRDPDDRRMIFVALTATGEALIREVFPIHLAAIVEELDVLSPEEQLTLGELCKRVGCHERIQEVE